MNGIENAYFAICEAIQVMEHYDTGEDFALVTCLRRLREIKQAGINTNVVRGVASSNGTFDVDEFCVNGNKVEASITTTPELLQGEAVEKGVSADYPRCIHKFEETEQGDWLCVNCGISCD